VRNLVPLYEVEGLGVVRLLIPRPQNQKRRFQIMISENGVRMIALISLPAEKADFAARASVPEGSVRPQLRP